VTQRGVPRAHLRHTSLIWHCGSAPRGINLRNDPEPVSGNLGDWQS